MTRFLLVAMLLWATPAVAQVQSTVDTRKILTGVEGAQDFGEFLLVPDDAKPVLKSVGFVSVDNEAAIIRVAAETIKREPIEVRKIDRTHFLIEAKGKIWLTITCVDFDKQIFEQLERQIVIEGDDDAEPDEPDNPDPDEPDDSDVASDEFDDLGKRIDALADAANLQFDLRQRVAEVYSDIAGKMESKEIIRTSDAVDQLNLGFAVLRLGSEWKPVLDLVRRDGGTREALTFATTIDWYKAVAAGFEG